MPPGVWAYGEDWAVECGGGGNWGRHSPGRGGVSDTNFSRLWCGVLRRVQPPAERKNRA